MSIYLFTQIRLLHICVLGYVVYVEECWQANCSPVNDCHMWDSKFNKKPSVKNIHCRMHISWEWVYKTYNTNFETMRKP